MRKFIDYTILSLSVALVIGAMLISFLSREAEPASDSVLRLSERNTVVLNTAITGESARDVQLELIKKSANLKSTEPIYLFLNSPGGSVDDGLQIVEAAHGLPNKVHTVSLFSASMSFVISQLLDERYVLPYATLMSHRAYLGGLEGQIPGSFVSRLDFILNQVREVDTRIAKRATMTLERYRELTKDELWLGAGDSRDLKFADHVTDVRCDHSLDGTVTKNFTILVFQVTAEFSKCPLITQPVSIKLASDRVNTVEEREEALRAVNLMFSNRAKFYAEYVRTGRLSQMFH